MTAKPDCQRQSGMHEFWWYCKRCQATWNERNTGPHWRPHNCPERKGREEIMSAEEAYRHSQNHDGK